MFCFTILCWVTASACFPVLDLWCCACSLQHADEGVSKVLIGNKADMTGKIQVTPEEGADLARRYGIPFFLTSAKTNMNVSEVQQP